MVRYFVALVVVGLVGFVLVNWYSFIFAKTVVGVVTGVERVEAPMTVITNNGANLANQVFSFAVAVKDTNSGEIFTASTEDRRWAVVKVHQCAVVKFLPYPPWSLSRSGAYFGARVIQVYDCGDVPH